MNTKIQRPLMLITIVLCVLLFIERFTGEIPHAIFGFILTILPGIHTWQQMTKMKYKNKYTRQGHRRKEKPE